MRGRRPTDQGVVPLREDDQPGSNLAERAAQKCAELEPDDISLEEREAWRRLALPLCHPQVDRLHATNVFMFTMLVRAVMRHERLRVELDELTETYKTTTRDGVQMKARPQVAQLNETFRQIRSLANEFGMTPASARAVTGGAQMGFNFPEDPSAEAYLT